MGEYLYILLFTYIAFEGFHEFSLVVLLRHLRAKHTYAHLKEGSTIDYFKYQIKSKWTPFFGALLNPKVIFFVVMFQVHHEFVLGLLHEIGDTELELLFNTWINRGIWLAAGVAGIQALIEYHNERERTRSNDKESKSALPKVFN